MHSTARAQARGGIAAAAAFLERAVALSADPAGRAERALAAAQAKFAAGDVDAAQALLTVAEVGPLDESPEAQVQRLRAEIAFEMRRGNEAPPLLLQAAQRLEAIDAELARDTYLEAHGVGALRRAGLRSAPTSLDVARAARSAPSARPAAGQTTPARRARNPLHGRLCGCSSDAQEGAASCYRDEPRQLDSACLAYAIAAMDLWDDEAWLEIVSARAQLARSTGTLSILQLLLDYLAGHHILAGELSTRQG